MESQKEPMEQNDIPEAEEEYSFMQETIKEETGRKRKAFLLILKYAVTGLAFGAAACLGFYTLKPWAQERFPEDPEEITIPSEEDDQGKELSGEQPEEPAQEDNAGRTEQEDVGEEAPEEAPALTMENYQELNRAWYDIALQVNKSVAEIVSGPEGSWQSDAFDAGGRNAGVIVADNGQSLLIFGKSTGLADMENLTVTFADDKTYPAELKRKDENLGVAVFAVDKEKIQDSTWEQIQIAPLGSSTNTARGEGVMALGRPFGYSGGLGYGIVSSTRHFVNRADGDYRVLCTDIAGAAGGTGVLANTRGEIIGLIDSHISEGGSANLTMAYGISDIKTVIEMLSNGNAVPYMGILGTTVTEQMAKSGGMPEGVYVREVAADSPAMNAGIQSGDIITSVGGHQIETLSAYHKELMDRRPGAGVLVSGQRQGADGYVEIKFDVTVGSRE